LTRIAALALLAALSWPLHARDALPAAVAAEAPGLMPLGTGTFSWLGLEIYTASLWARGGTPDFGQPLALALRYARSLKGAAIAERSAEEMRQLGVATPEQLAAWRADMEALFPDVSKGTTLMGVHLPGEGARFYRDGRLLGTIRGADFSRAFFSIWLHPQTSAPKLRAALLGPG
jgi:hypothetical protein